MKSVVMFECTQMQLQRALGYTEDLFVA